MKDEVEIEEACEWVIKQQRFQKLSVNNSYLDGLRDALDWVLDNLDDDPTLDE